MAEKMTFPKTMKEFIEEYSFTDIVKVYTNGAELIPVFRVEQALEHYLPEVKSKAVNEFVEKVVAELEEQKWAVSDWRDKWRNEIISNCIDIVKRGGVE